MVFIWTRGVIESSQYRAKLELDSIKKLEARTRLEVDRVFFFKCSKLDSKNSRLDKAQSN